MKQWGALILVEKVIITDKTIKKVTQTKIKKYVTTLL